MASITPQRADHPSQPPSQIRRVSDEDRRAALALLLTGRPVPHEPAVDQFLQFAREHDLALDRFWAAYHADKLVTDCLVLPSAGRTAMVFLAPVPGPSQTALSAQVIRAAVDHEDPARTALLQALLDPPQHLEQRALTKANFTLLATLNYMQRDADVPLRLLDLPIPDLRILHYRQDRRQAFANAILATYENTLDCPALVGLRAINDIIAGHMATGRFDPDLWFALYQENQPVAVMLLTDVPARHVFELVYLGVAAPYRGRGLAKRLLHHGLGVVSRHAVRYPHQPTRLCLAVDDQNQPAIRLYRSLGFQHTARKIAMVCSLKN